MHIYVGAEKRETEREREVERVIKLLKSDCHKTRRPPEADEF